MVEEAARLRFPRFVAGMETVAARLVERAFLERDPHALPARHADEAPEAGAEAVRLGLLEHAARGYRLHSGDESWEAEPRGFFHHASETEARDVGDLRFRIRTGDAVTALPRLRALLSQAESGRRGWRALRLRILEAEALDALGDRTGALRALHEALKRSAGEGFVRSFVDEGPTLLSLVRLFHDRSRTSEEASADEIPRAHAARILAAAGLPVDAAALGDAPELAAPLEPLSEREREILTLVSEGLSNRVLAKRLFVSEHTVKWHLLKIFQKLRVHSRSRAVAVARHQQLIP
jgi:LuxR family transcriptional regulator, maltose regulon positive regulatory protein